jgi:hypothetical protein
MKKCNKCGEEKSLSEFYKSSKAKSGYRSPCKNCINAVSKSYRVNNQDRIKEYKKNWALENRKKKDKKSEIWYLNDGTWVRKCSKCKEEKSLDEFYRCFNSTSGRVSQCKTCRHSQKRKYYYDNLDTQKKIRRNNYERNRLSYIIRAKLRRRNVRHQTPKWLTFEQRREIELIYEHARECEALTGDQYVVDHIVPLKGVNVCGLHVPWNLQVLPSDVNDSKGNKLIEELAVAHG